MQRKRKIVYILNALMWLAVLVFVVSKCSRPEPSPHSEDATTITVFKEDGVYKSDLDFPINEWPTTVIVDSTNFWKPTGPVPPDTSDIDPPEPPIVDYDFDVDTEAELTAAAKEAQPGDVVAIRNGTYRVTVVPANNGVEFRAYQDHTPLITGLNQVTTPWVVYSGDIYKTQITLPVNGHQSKLTSNTTILSNQVFKGASMMFEARWPNIFKEEDLFDLKNRRHVSQMVSFTNTQLVDNSIPVTGLAGGKLVTIGWFRAAARIINSQPSKNTLQYNDILGSDPKYRKWYYITGKLNLLDAEKEWHYENGTLYFRQPGGGSPVGIEYKARNWGFDIRGKDNIKIIGIHFFGCEPAMGDTESENNLLDGVRAKFTNHAVMLDTDEFPGYGNAKQTGTKLIGANNVFTNSEVMWTASHGIWLGEKGMAINNFYKYCGYEGSWGAPFSFWGDYDNEKFLWNTISHTGRSAIDMGYSYTPKGSHKNLNVEVAYNDISMWGMLNNDLGAIYAWGFRDLTGGVVHHNWFHHAGVVPDPTGKPLDGGQRGTYLDQASGPMTFHHNLYFKNFENLTQNASDHYTQPHFEHRIAGPSLHYNNTYASVTHFSYTTYESSPWDEMRNNIWTSRINLNWGNGNPGDSRNSLNSVMHPASTPYINPIYVGPGGSGLDYRIQSSSPARNIGTSIPGITDNDDGTPDAGAYAYSENAKPWVPGYKPVKAAPSDRIEDNDARTVYSHPKTTFSNHVFSGGTASFMTVDLSTITVNFTGSGLEWWSEKMENHGMVKVFIDDKLKGTVDLYSADHATNENNSTKVFTATDLGEGSHKLVLQLSGKNPQATALNIIHDYVKILPEPAQQSIEWWWYLLFLVVLLVTIASIVYLLKKERHGTDN